MIATSPRTEPERVHAVACSSGIRALVNLPNFLEVDSVVAPNTAQRENLNVSTVVVWGRKENSTAALSYASEHDIPVTYLEDGWIRTSSSDAHSRRVYSLLVDNAGVYYDCSTPSELENLLNLDDSEFGKLFGAKEKNEAKFCRDYLVKNSITKYNFCVGASTEEINQSDKPLVLVIDQTAGDASLTNGGMTADRFEHMLKVARDENPNARLMVRTHPDVVSGRKSGHLTQLANELGIELSAAGDNPIDWLKRAEKIYVGTSQLGYEALLCGVEVHVFGKPFYAGWGLTIDHQKIARRSRTRSIDELFYVCHMRIARYCHPVSGKPCSLRDCLQHVNLQKHEFQRNAHHFVGTGITLWKRRFLKQFLRSPDGSVRFSSSTSIDKGETKLTWSFRDKRRFDEKVNETNGSITKNDGKSNEVIHRIEDGFLRSQGLGSNFVAPASIVLDSRGIYFDPSSSSDLEHLLQHHDCTLEQTKRAGLLINKILTAGVSKYNVGNSDVFTRTNSSKNALLVVGQVADDESIRRGSLDVNTNLSLCEAVREANPDAYIVFKPHPDVVSGNRKGAIPDDVARKIVNEVSTNTNITDCFNDCSEVHTITSQSGFEALMRGKRVVTYGLPFYAGWGLTQDRHQLARRTRNRTLEELVYCCLVAYPKYLDINSGEFIRPEDLIDLFLIRGEKNNMKSKKYQGKRDSGSLLQKANNISKALTYKAR